MILLWLIGMQLTFGFASVAVDWRKSHPLIIAFLTVVAWPVLLGRLAAEALTKK